MYESDHRYNNEATTESKRAPEIETWLSKLEDEVVRLRDANSILMTRLDPVSRLVLTQPVSSNDKIREVSQLAPIAERLRNTATNVKQVFIQIDERLQRLEI